MKEKKKEPSPSLVELGRVLAKNYFDTSQTLFRTTSRRGVKNRDVVALKRTAELVFTDPDPAGLAAQRPERTVLVLGSGASIAAFGGDAYPGTAAAIQHMRKKLRLDTPQLRWLKDKIEREKRHIQNAYNYADALNDFETNLGLLAEHFGQSVITDELAEMYGERYYPHLAFEIIAHLFKHRFIDVIINYNFDELLDEAIAGEMGTAQYHHVLFDGQCRGLGPLLVGNRLKVPLYIKPHGTVSHRSSMRFTKTQYFQLPEPMRHLLAQVISGHWVENPQKPPAEHQPYQPYRVNIITVGFSMKSVELLRILKDVAEDPKSSRIMMYHLNRKDGRKELEALARSQGWPPKIRQQFINMEDHDGFYETMRMLWHQTTSHFQKPCEPRGIARHELVHNLFFAGGPKKGAGKRVPAPEVAPALPRGANLEETRQRDPNKDLEYFRARLYAEVAMALARGAGEIDLATMSESRVGKQFDLMRDCPGGTRISMHEVLKPFTQDGRVELGGPDNSIFRISFEPSDDAEVLNKRLAETIWVHLLKALHGIGNAQMTKHLDAIEIRPRRRDKMIERFRRLAASDAQDISPNFRHSHLLLSQEPKSDDVLHTNLGLTLRFMEMLQGEWDLMLAVSEHARVLDKYWRHLKAGGITHSLRDKRICLVVADSDFLGVVEKRLEPFQDVLVGWKEDGRRYFKIPAWAHNQHMILLLKRDGPEWKTMSAVRYEQIGLGRRVNPVYIKDSGEDLRSALDCFKRYVHMSVEGKIPVKPGASPVASELDHRRKADTLWDSIVGEI